MHRRDVCGVALLALAACGSVNEPTIAPGWTAAEAAKPLHRSDCVRLALAWAPGAAAWKARRDAAEAELRQAKTLPNPSLLVEWEDFGILSAAGSLVQTTYSLGIALSDLFSTSGRGTAATHARDAVIADLLAERRNLALDVCRAYDQLLAARKGAELAKRLAANQQRARDAVARRVRVGLEAGVDLQRAEVEVMEAEAEAAQKHNEARAQELALAFALGFARPVELQLADDLITEIEAPVGDLEALLATAAETRPEIAAAKARYESELERLHLAASPVRFLPTVAPGYRTLDGEHLGVASLDLELPVFDTGSARIAAQDAGLLAAAAAMRKAAQATAQDVAAAAQQWTAAQAFLHEHAEPLAARRRTLRADLERLFEAGQASFDTMLVARRDELRAEQTRLTAALSLSEAAWPLRVDTVLSELDASVRERK